MKFSEQWLRTLVNPALDTQEFSDLLTMAGLEVEECVSAAPPFNDVVVAQVLTTQKHPDADKLKLCSVDVGAGAPLQIVCGAPNVAPGIKIPCALVGAELPGGLSIKAAKVRGIESFGMLCSARELGLSSDHGGLLVLAADAPVGRSIREHLGLDDHLITVKLTPNRADCLSLVGIAREVSALTGVQLMLPAIGEPAAVNDKRRPIVLDAPNACPRFCGRVIADLKADAPIPGWMRERIERSGLRCINAVVDVTNYVMLELGQPLHAYDNAALSGALHARYARSGESLELLNGQRIQPDANTLVIADEARILGLAGIMGGAGSGVQGETREIFLEAAFFAPDVIAGKARALGFSSDASHRFERGVDFGNTRNALARATELILAICGGTAGPVVEALSEADLPQRAPTRMRRARAETVLGIALNDADILRAFSALGFSPRTEAGDFVITPPTHRFDIAIEEDLIEEVVRVLGYASVPPKPPVAPTAMLALPEARRSVWALRRLIAARDYQEVINFSFVDSVWEQDFCANEQPVRVANPIASQMGVMRSSLIAGLVDNLATNRKRQIERVRVFEIGRCFLRGGEQSVAGFAQPMRVAGLAGGYAHPEQWGVKTRLVDFFDVKADVETLLAPRNTQFEKISHPALHPGRAAAVLLDNRSIGIVGELHPQWVQKYDLGSAPVVFELELQPLLEVALPHYFEASRFPAVVRDLALLVPLELPAQTLLAGLREDLPSIVKTVEVFDVYHGKGVPEDQKSLAVRVVMQDTERTLAEDEVEAARSRLIRLAEEKFSAKLRA